MNKRIRLSTSVALCLGLLTGAARGQPSDPIYVDVNSIGIPYGTSWFNAYRHLQDALAAARGTPPFVGEIRVADGTYYPDRDSPNPGGTGIRGKTFALIDNVEIKGGYAGSGATNPDLRDPSVFVTILSGDIGDTGVQSDNSYNVVTGSSRENTALIDGFTIVDGFADNTGGTLPGRGAGMIIEDGSPTINNCIFKDNEADISGGGIFSSGGGPTISNCQFLSNISEALAGGWHQFAGGGLTLTDGGGATAEVTDCVFSDNRATASAGTSKGGALAIWDIGTTVTRCDFIDNFAGSGGAVILGAEVTGNDGVSVTFADCLFQGNTSAGMGIPGGAVKIGPDNAVPITKFVNCRFIGNSESAIWQESPAAATTPEFINCLFRGNSGSGGGAIQAEQPTAITNCTFSDNHGGFGGAIHWSNAQATIKVRNSVFWGNVDAQNPDGQIFPTSGSGADVTHSLIFDGMIDENILFGGTANANIDDDPLYVDEDPDFRLQDVSPALEEGDDDAISEAFDLDGNPRKIGIVDMGAYERCANDAECDINAGCTTDICTAGVCSHNFLCSGETPACVNDVCVCETDAHCDDGNDCTDDVCNGSGECDHANEPAETACEDGLFCTTGDECDGAGTCVGGSSNPCRSNQICCECGIDDGFCIAIGNLCSCP